MNHEDDLKSCETLTLTVKELLKLGITKGTLKLPSGLSASFETPTQQPSEDPASDTTPPVDPFSAAAARLMTRRTGRHIPIDEVGDA